MKPMKFFKGPLFRKNIFNNRKQALTVRLYKFSRIFVTYYNRWHQSTNGITIEIVIKLNREKPLKLNSVDTFFEKVSLLEVKNFMGFMMI